MLPPPPPGTATRALDALVQLQSGYGGDDDGGGWDLNGEFEHIMGGPQCHMAALGERERIRRAT